MWPLLRSRSVFDNARELVLEIHFGEGGTDSKRFVYELFSAYARWAASRSLSIEILDDENGHVIATVAGPRVWEAFKNERGNHVVQRYPDNDRGGRRHTSLISVAVLPLPPKENYEPLPENELEVKFQPGKRGPGGQHKNKTASAVRMKHVPTGLSVFIDGRHQAQNRNEALRILTTKVNQYRNQQSGYDYAAIRRAQIDGSRGDKVRTYNFIEGRVTDHKLGLKSGRIEDIMRGRFDLLFDK